MAKKKVTKKEQKRNKEFVQKLLLVENKDYDEWLNEKHEEHIQENSELLLEALEKAIDNKSDKKFNSNNEQNIDPDNRKIHHNKGGNK